MPRIQLVLILVIYSCRKGSDGCESERPHVGIASSLLPIAAFCRDMATFFWGLG